MLRSPIPIVAAYSHEVFRHDLTLLCPVAHQLWAYGRQRSRSTCGVSTQHVQAAGPHLFFSYFFYCGTGD
jgi:hypothetical protein